MSNFALATLAIRLMGVYAWFQVLSVLPALPYFFIGGLFDRRTLPAVAYVFAASIVIALAVWTLLGYFLIFRAEKIARILAPAAEEPRPPDSDPGSLQAVLFSVVGLVLVVHSIPRVIRYVAQLSVYEDVGSHEAGKQWIYVASLALEFLLGVAIFLGSRGLSRLWRRIGEMNRMP